MVYELAWFVGGDINKIKKLQGTLRRQGYSKVVQDGVYGVEIEQAWLDYVYKTLEPYGSYNFVVGASGHFSGHAMALGGDLNLGIYIDEDFNIGITRTYGAEASTSFSKPSFGGSIEWSKTAMTLEDLGGKSVTNTAYGRIPLTKIDVSKGQSRSFYKGDVIVDSLSISFNGGAPKYGINTGASNTVLVKNFNPKEWLKEKLGIR